jgi:hypothetical protein
MAKKQTIDLILKAFKDLGGNISDVLGTRTNVSFLGVGDNVEPFLDKNLNTEALGVLSQSKAVDEVKNSVGFAVGEKLNDIQANNLLTNLNKMKEFYMPAPVTNITDLATGTRNLDAEGLASLRLMADDFGYVAPEEAAKLKELKKVDLPEGVDPRDTILPSSMIDDLPPPGSRGGADDIAAPVQDAETTIRNLEAQEAGLGAQFKNIVTNRGDVPGKRASAREFLVEALKKDEYDVGTPAFGKTQLNNIISAEDVRYITEGGGGIGGDPIVLVEKYFGPRIAEALPVNASNEEIAIFTKRVLENVRDSAGLKPDNPKFDRFTAMFIDEMADGGRVGLRFGKLAGKAFGLMKKAKAIEKSVDAGEEMGYQALRKYGLEAEDISRLFRDLAMDRTMVGPEKTEYFKMLNQVLKNPDDFPDGIIEIKKRLGMDFARGGLAKILEV